MTVLFACALIYTEFAYAQAGAERPPMPVPVINVAQDSILPYEQTYPARLSAVKEVEVHARVSGVIKQQFYREGQTVKAGDKLYQLDDRRYQARLKQAQANVTSLQAQLKQAKRVYQRLLDLAKRQSVSQQQVDEALATQESLEAQIQAAQAAVISAQIELDDTTIEAEISGVIGQKQQDIGDLMDPVSGKTLLNTIRQTEQLYVHFSLSDHDRQALFTLIDAGLLKPNTPPKITLINPQGQALAQGTLNFQDNQIDAATASQLFRALIDNANQRLLSGQLLRVKVEHGTWQNVMTVPQKAVIQNGPQAFVYVASEGTAQMRPITLAGAYQDQWLVSKGLKSGEQVITGNLIKLRPNSPIQILAPVDSTTTQSKE